MTFDRNILSLEYHFVKFIKNSFIFLFTLCTVCNLLNINAKIPCVRSFKSVLMNLFNGTLSLPVFMKNSKTSTVWETKQKTHIDSKVLVRIVSYFFMHMNQLYFNHLGIQLFFFLKNVAQIFGNCFASINKCIGRLLFLCQERPLWK